MLGLARTGKLEATEVVSMDESETDGVERLLARPEESEVDGTEERMEGRWF